MTYSPRISKELVAKLYQLALARQQPMTRVVDDLLRTAFARIEAGYSAEVVRDGDEVSRRHWRYRIVSYILVEPEEDLIYNLEEAQKEKAHLELLQPENRYEMEAVRTPP